MDREQANPQEISETRKLPVNEKWILESEGGEVNVHLNYFEELLKSLEQSWLDDEDKIDLKISFDEALINAFKYGGGGRIIVEIKIDNLKCQVSVLDSNPKRFDPKTAFNSVKNSGQILATHGRGITLMEAYCDSVDYSFHNPGNKVTLIKRNLSENDNS